MISVRPATAADRPHVEELVQEYLDESFRAGSDIVPSRRSVEFFLGVFDRIVSGELDGVALLGGDDGLHLAADAMLPWDSTFGRVALGHFTYVRPRSRRSGVALALRTLSASELAARGFDALIGGAETSNVAGIESAQAAGAVVYQVQLVHIYRPGKED